MRTRFWLLISAVWAFLMLLGVEHYTAGRVAFALLPLLLWFLIPLSRWITTGSVRKQRLRIYRP
jgi:hypothetical protein